MSILQKPNRENKVVVYKARLVAQEFSQRTDFDCEDTHSPRVDALTFW